jgi:hypothetical protein
MDRPDSMELFHKPVQDVLVLGPESVTLRFPSSPVVNISDLKMNYVPHENFTLNVQGVMSHPNGS